MSTKFSQFASGGLLKVGSSIVGLNANVSPTNTKFDFPGTGILDANDSYLIGWSHGLTPGVAANYINIENGVSGSFPVIRASGSDVDVGLILNAKGAGSILLVPGGSGNVEVVGDTAFVVPVGTTAQRPAGTAGALRYNTDVGLIEFYDAVGTMWSTLSSSTGISSVTGTLNRIDISGPSTDPVINISDNYVGQNTITTVGALAAGSLASGFTPVSVSIGGTGVAAISAYSVVCGGTTGTGNLQNVVGLGTAGQGLLSNGAGALPSWNNVVTNIITGPGLSGGPITSNGTINIVANDFCSGRLTLTTGVPVTAGDVAGATVVYFTPYRGNYINLYNGSTWDVYSFSQISIAVPAVANQMYDVFIYSNVGTLTLTLVAWTNDTTRATAIVLQNGIYCQSGTLANRYLGSFRTTSIAGQTEDSVLKRYVYNYYNRVDRALYVTETTATWLYTVNVYRQANGSAANQVEFVCGVIEDQLDVTVSGGASTSSTSRVVSSGIGINSTTVNSAIIFGSKVEATVENVPAIYRGTGYGVGRNFIAWLEFSNTGGVTTWYGTGIGLTGFNSATGLTANILM